MSVKSPCTRQCSLNNDNVCVGCGRNVLEIKRWRKSNDEERLKVIQESSERLSRLQEMRDDGFLSDT